MAAQDPISQPTPQKDSSYVDSYQPPTEDVAPIDPVALTNTQDDIPTVSDVSATPATPTPPATPATPTPPVVPVPDSTTITAPVTLPTTSEESESLQDQNIFYLLGVEDGADEERELFLDELQQVIWEDFIENDVKVLISEEEMTKLRQMMNKGDGQDVQEEMVVYLEKLIPDLEDIMLEKALELKEEMIWERIAGMREYYVDKPESLVKLDEAEQLAKKDQWHQVAEVLNAIGK